MFSATILAAILSTLAFADERMFDVSKDKVLYCVGYAHLDTQWRWDYCTTIDQFIKDTLQDNFALFEKYPDYVFNFTGIVRYEMMKEYYPELYEKLKTYIAQGRWRVSGSSVDEGDVNVPSAEAIIRQVLYGNEFFRREFGKESIDYMLPDCFGFPASMPSIWAHCGLKGFSTQKLTWGSAVGIPFKIGMWEGPDGNSVVAAFDPGSYGSAIQGPVQTNAEWIKRIEDNGRKYGVFADYHYYGTGDQGGAPRDEDVANYVASAHAADAPIKVALVSSDQLFRDLTDEQKSKLPRYKGDLLLTEHSAGTLTSQAYMKRWNRKNENLADAAERAAVAAHWLGAAEYPREQLNKSWVRALANQMHDILPGTSIPRAYTYSWNDELVALNGFADVLTNSVGAISRGLDTNVPGTPLIVYNPLAIAREDLVEARVEFPEGAPKAVRVYDAQKRGRETPSQIQSRDDKSITVLFVARIEPVSLTVFDVRAAEESYDSGAVRESPLRISPTEMKGEDYIVTIDENGDVRSIQNNNSCKDRKTMDPESGRPGVEKECQEILAAPLGLVFTFEKPSSWPAWNMDWYDRREAPLDRVKGPAKVRIVENGPVRVALEIERKANDSIITQQIRLAVGDAGKRIEFKTTVDWQSTECALKASFQLKASNPTATYNWGMGTIERGNNEPKKYEVPSHEWFDLTDKSNNFGVSILDDCKYGSDKPSDNEVRLTLLYTPGVRGAYMDQHSQDWGRHEMTYAIYPHSGDWKEAQTEWQARQLNQQLRVFQASKHSGELGRKFGLVTVSTPQVDIRAIKQAEREDAIVVRLQELWGSACDEVSVNFLSPIVGAYEADGQERRIGEAKVENGKLITSMKAYGPRTFVVRTTNTKSSYSPPKSEPITLPFVETVTTHDGKFLESSGRFGMQGALYYNEQNALDQGALSIPAEEFPKSVISGGVRFQFGPTGEYEPNAVGCEGEQITLPEGEFDRLYLLASSLTDEDDTLRFGGKEYPFHVQTWTDFIGQFDNRIWDKEFGEVDHICDGKVIGFKTGYIKRDPIAWFCTHRHHFPKGNEAYKFSYMFRYGFDIPTGAKSFTLPKNYTIKIFAATVASNTNDCVRPAWPLYDDFTNREPIKFRHVYPPPLPPVYAGLTSSAQVKTERKASFEELTVATPSSTDFADQATNPKLAFRLVKDRGKYRPHNASGEVDGTLPRLNDGAVQGNEDDTKHSIWFDGPGRFYIDLGRSVAIDKVNTFSRHRSNRAPQLFSLWGFDGDEAPSPTFTDGTQTPWKLLAIVNTKDLGEGGVHASSISGDNAPLGTFRHLLWITDDIHQGTFFGEIDVIAQP